MHHDTDAYYLKSPAEMAMHFRDVPQALETRPASPTRASDVRNLSQTHLPRFQCPRADAESYLAELAQKGLEQRLQAMKARASRWTPIIPCRLALELGVIQKMAFSGYFLIVWDFIRFAKENANSGRTGARLRCGSLVRIRCVSRHRSIVNKLLLRRFLTRNACPCRTSTWTSAWSRSGDVVT